MPTHGDITPADVVSHDLGSREFHAQAPARTREEAAPEADHRVSPNVGVWVQSIMNGASLWHSQPPSLAMSWERHVASAHYFQSGVFRGLRWCWAAIHIAVGAPMLLLYWLFHSFPLVIAAAAILAAAHWLL